MSSSIFSSTKLLSLGSCAFRQWTAIHSHCSKIHGYELKAKFYFSGRILDSRNWIVDFGDLDLLKEKLNSIFDHTLCVAADDPCLPDFRALHDKGVVDLRVFERGVGIERVAEICFEIASEFLEKKHGKLRWVDKVEVYEHDRNSAIYYNPAYVDQSVVAQTPEEGYEIIENYLKNEAEKTEETLNTTMDKIREEIAKEYPADVAKELLKEIPSNQDIGKIVRAEVENVKKEIDNEIQQGLASGATSESLPTPTAAPSNSTAAPVGARPTTGNYSGLFAGTRWG